jgi:hypothetical protein
MTKGSERRVQERVALVNKLAICYSPTHESLYNVLDLSQEGARIAQGPLMEPGTAIRIEILDGPLAPLRLKGRVVHCGTRGMGVTFAEDEFRRVERIHGMMERARARAQPELY